MLRIILAVLLELASPRAHELAIGALGSAPSYLTVASADDHAFAAAVAGDVYGIDPALLLSIAWHESRYQVAAVTPEAGGKVSCGVMTPVPQVKCQRETLLESYLVGASHLASWIHATRGNLRTALVGYAGGWRLIRFCLDGGEAKGCRVPDVFLGRAARIRRGATS